MQPHDRRAWTWLVPVALLSSMALVPSALASPTRAQDPVPEQGDAKKPIEIPINIPGGDANDPHEEMKKLFGKVERRLLEIDKLLRNASAGDTKSLSKAGPAGLDELLKSSAARSREAVESIDKILEIANHEHPPGGT